MRCLCVMARSRPAGYLVIGNRPCTPDQLAKMVGESQETVVALLDELSRNEVFATTRRGTIYNRRMARRCCIERKESHCWAQGADAKIFWQNKVCQRFARK